MVNEKALKAAMKSWPTKSNGKSLEEILRTAIEAYEAAKVARGEAVKESSTFQISKPKSGKLDAFCIILEAFEEIHIVKFWELGIRDLAAIAAKAVNPYLRTNTAPPADDRAAFEAKYKHLELDKKSDAWGRPMYKHSHVDALWNGWQGAREYCAAQGIALRNKKIQQRINKLCAYLKEFNQLKEQKHLDEGTPERLYWHQGYMQGLKDAIATTQQTGEG